MTYLVPKNLFSKDFARFPDIWEDLETDVQRLGGFDQSGLSISEDDNKVYVEAKMPGLKVADIDVTLDNGILAIQGERKEEEADKKRKFHKKTSFWYSYRVTLPTQTDEHNPEAHYVDGMMSITFNKLPQSKGIKIPVNGS